MNTHRSSITGTDNMIDDTRDNKGHENNHEDNEDDYTWAKRQ